MDNTNSSSDKDGIIYSCVKNNIPFDTEILKKAMTVLHREGFTCSIQREIVHWYSNTDYDEEEYFIMNW